MVELQSDLEYVVSDRLKVSLDAIDQTVDKTRQLVHKLDK
jgi:hypothetical protein